MAVSDPSKSSLTGNELAEGVMTINLMSLQERLQLRPLGKQSLKYEGKDAKS